MKKILSIAGSDCSGGAGIQADLKTFAAHGLYGMSVIASVVAENTAGVTGRQDIRPEMVGKQIDTIFEDIGADAVKIGMLPGSACMKVVADRLRKYKPRNIVIDPVMTAKDGCPLMKSDSMDALISEIIPMADLLTPNIPEAEKITGVSVHSARDMEQAAKQLYLLGARSVLIKGGHAAGDALDILFDGKRFTRLRAKRIVTRNTHGTGCTYSSAIASNLAMGLGLEESVKKAKNYITTAILHALPIGKGCGPTNHFYDLYRNGLKKGALTDEL